MSADLRVQYSILVPVGSSGNGLIAGIETAAAHRAGCLSAVYSTGCCIDGLPFHRVSGFQLPLIGRRAWGKRINWNLSARVFDWSVARSLDEGDLFHGWAFLSLKSIERAKALGMTTIIERGSIHAAEWAQIVRDEYARIGLEGEHFLCHDEIIDRSVREYDAVDVILSPSSYVTDSFRRAGFGDKVCTLPLGVDTTLFQPVTDFEEKCSPFTVLFFGMIDPRKGVHDLIEAAGIIRDRKFRLQLIGNASPAYMSILNELDVPFDYSPFLPHADLKDRVARAGVCVFPSVEDGFAMVVTESLASGTPVIVTDCVGARDWVGEGDVGFVVPSRSPESIAEKLSILIDDPEEAFQMGLRGRERVRQNSWQQYGARLLSLWQGVRRGERFHFNVDSDL